MKARLTAVGAMLLAGFIVPAATDPPAGAPATRAAKRTVFAAPFENATGQQQYEPAAAGMGDLVAVLLAQQEHIAVVERQQLAALAAEKAKSLKGLTGNQYAIQAGKLLKADTVLVGRLYLLKGKLTVNVKALDIATARVVAAGDLSCRPNYLIEAALQLARQLGKRMALPLPKIDLKKIDKAPIASLHFAKALSHYYAGNMDAAIMQLMRTLDLDPNYTEVAYWSGLCYFRLGESAHAIIELEKFLKEHGDSHYAENARGLLTAAKHKEKDSGVKRLGPKPTTAPQGPSPASRPAASQPSAAGHERADGAPTKRVS